MTSLSVAEDNSTVTEKKRLLGDTITSKASRKPNPIWKYLGFGENFHPRLPSRNWMIFLSTVGSFSAAVIYDKREKKRNQIKWCKLVEHISKQPLESRTMPRKITVFLEAPPMGGLRSAQDHFKEYVKPILVSSGLDWEFIQGREEGDIRTKVADRIRFSRLPKDLQTEKDDIARYRMNNGIKDTEGPRGDIVIGRNTWKEYVIGQHEGWLTPIEEISKTESLPQSKEQESASPVVSSETSNDSLKTNPSSPECKAPESSEKPKLPPNFIDTRHYSTIPLSADIPDELEPSIPISFPHVLGFLNTPKRIYRFLNRRKMADSIGRDIAAVVLSSYQPYDNFTEEQFQTESIQENYNLQVESTAEKCSYLAEQQIALQEEEKDWHKSVWVLSDEIKNRTWQYPIVLDPRIATRMRRFKLSSGEDERAQMIVVSEQEIEGSIKSSIRALWKASISYFRLKDE